MPTPDVATLNQVTRPSLTSDGQHAPAPRFGDTPVMVRDRAGQSTGAFDAVLVAAGSRW